MCQGELGLDSKSNYEKIKFRWLSDRDEFNKDWLWLISWKVQIEVEVSGFLMGQTGSEAASMQWSKEW